MAQYFDKFPTTPYNINYDSNNTNSYDMPVNIMVRVGVLINTLERVFHYYDYVIKEGETPEILADKFYGDSEAHWLILLTNNIVDPQYGWVLHYDAFNKYIVDKYGSIATAKTTTHHWELVRKIQDVTTELTTYNRSQITELEYNALVTAGTPVVEQFGYTAKTVGSNVVRIFPEYVTTIDSYDWEIEQNEARRNIKLIKREYYEKIKNEFDSIMMSARPSRKKSGIRSLR